MSKRSVIANGRLWKLCAIGIATAALSDAANAQFLNSADVFAFPFGNTSALDHQVKSWNVSALADAQDAAFYYTDNMDGGLMRADGTPVPNLPAATQVGGPIATETTSVTETEIQPPVRATLPPRSTPRNEKPGTVAAAASTDDAAVIAQAILDRLAARQIDASTAAALLQGVLNAKKDAAGATTQARASSAPASNPVPRIAVAAAASAPATRTWPLRANSTVRETLSEWAALAGWKVPKWDTADSTPYRIVNGQSPTGTFMDALDVLARAMPQFDIRVTANNRELVVTDHAGDSDGIGTAVAYAGR
ncbi:TcpQ domain-containing protein [Burkholderia aenigmatica]|uniref:TcpQ domain-containing protein n=1 Tax=Burkholderia aenigmatica TaxID=2015348 RepID=UPI00264F2EA8|nr:TcpQ domain-containing protein [Burkholderia aenigmatica]MDN7880123.1 TcpQ domain-containing protein [Burkholderia aenigmatica]